MTETDHQSGTLAGKETFRQRFPSPRPNFPKARRPNFPKARRPNFPKARRPILPKALASTEDLGRRDAVVLRFDLPDVELPAKTLTNIGIIMNELATNSVKYAFEDTKEPEISLSGRVAGGRLRLLYRDNGRGLPEGFDPAASTGLGMLLVQNIAKSYKGSVAIEGGSGAGFAIELSIEEAQAMTGRGESAAMIRPHS